MSSVDQPRLLFVSPVVPALGGNGLAMRAGAVLQALARRYRVTLLLTPRYGDRFASLPPALASSLAQVVRISDGETLSEHVLFDLVHVFRLASLPDAAPWLANAARIHLDMDEIESRSEHRLAGLARSAGQLRDAEQAASAAQEARLLEDEALARFDRVYVAADGDRERLLQRDTVRAEVVTLPNTLPLPVTTPFPPPTRGNFALLFVGALGHAPNEDALLHFCTSILPRIQAGAHRAVTLRIVGGGAGPAVQRLAGQAGVELIGPVDDLTPRYRDAHLVVVPLRAGGGTRIKLLEAFAMRRAVVSTTLGVEGLAAEHQRHLLIADEPAPFATATLRLLHDRALAEQMADEAYALFAQDYAAPLLDTILA